MKPNVLCVLAIQRRLHQRTRTNPARNGVCVFVRGRPLDGDGDELGRALPVADDELREVHCEGRELVAEGGEGFGGGVFVDQGLGVGGSGT